MISLPRRGPALAAIVLAGLLLPAAAHAAAGPSHPLLFTLAGETKAGHPVPPPEGELEDACGVALDAAGDIYVSDYYHHTIDVYGPTREYLTQIADHDPDGPCNLAVDAAGEVYVNNWRRDVVRFSPSEFPPTQATTYGAPAVIDFPAAPGARSTGLALDPSTGALYVDDRTFVAVYEPAALLAAEPEPSRTFGLGTLGQGYGIAVSTFPATAGNVYVPDVSTSTVRVFGPSGALAGAFDGAGDPQHGFVSLVDSAVAVDPGDGHLFVADNTEPDFEAPAAVVDEFNPAGDYRGQLPHAIVDAGPSALAVDSGGRVYVTSGNSEGAALFGFGPTEPAHLLEVARTGGGSGTITSEPAGIQCGAACAAEYNAGEEVVLTAVPAAGSAFIAWSGCEHPSATRCRLTLSADRSVSAEFEEVAESSSLAMAGAASPAASPPASGPAAAGLSVRELGEGPNSALVEIGLPAAGALTVRGAGIHPVSRRSPGGTLALRLHLTAAAARALAVGKVGRLRVPLRVKLQPSGGGAALVAARTVLFRRNRQGRNR